MASRGRARKDGRARRTRPDRSRRPERVRRAASARARGAGSARARVRAGLRSKRVAGAVRALGLSTTRRAAILAIVVCALALTLAVPLRTYLAQQAEVAEQEERKAQLEHMVAKLEQRKAELDDPAQIEAEARTRLRYVMPGETPYIVQLPDSGADADTDTAVEDGAHADPWFERLWSGITEG